MSTKMNKKATMAALNSDGLIWVSLLKKLLSDDIELV